MKFSVKNKSATSTNVFSRVVLVSWNLKTGRTPAKVNMTFIYSSQAKDILLKQLSTSPLKLIQLKHVYLQFKVNSVKTDVYLQFKVNSAKIVVYLPF